jgi:hypothetical protein
MEAGAFLVPDNLSSQTMEVRLNGTLVATQIFSDIGWFERPLMLPLAAVAVPTSSRSVGPFRPVGLLPHRHGARYSEFGRHVAASDVHPGTGGAPHSRVDLPAEHHADEASN